ncbi:competence type IV pilus ATPase ComGA [Pontibacillus salicampi]|uniref:Competence type IV pilus ATPase ComGA n=1 Tax=Pontibacillus salicampi TaxID=1449801 RepID=A0ABV6LJY6_9BACI
MSIADQSKQLLADAITSMATDIHFCPYGTQVYIYYRVHGGRLHRKTIALSLYEPLLSYFKFASGMDIGEILHPQNGILPYEHNHQHYSLRFSTLPVQSTESLAIRILPQKAVPSLRELFLFPHQLHRVQSWIRYGAGLILFTGPTGSGKTTTLYALLQTLLREHSYQTITLEDPIENQLKDILQVQVNEKAGMDYNAGLKAALRHDPDILMVGEIRDASTAHFAIRAAQTGHLVLSSLHAKNAYGTLFRMLEMGISNSDLQQTLIGIASQQLISIETTSNIQRSAILELLEGKQLEEALLGISPYNSPHYVTFHQLRRKAYALGYLSKERV